MKGEYPQKKAKGWKICNGLLALALISVFCLGHLVPNSRPYDSTPNQRFNSFGSCDLKDRLLAYFTPNPIYILRSAGSLINSEHFAAICDYDYLLSRPSLARLIESASGRFQTEIKMDSTLKVRAPPLFFSDKSIL